MKSYLDSSAFAKRFVDEPGSDKVEMACAQASELGLSVLCVPEIVSALNRRRREHSLTKNQYAKAKRRLLDDVRDADIIGLTMPVVGSSIHVLEAKARFEGWMPCTSPVPLSGAHRYSFHRTKNSCVLLDDRA